jgi:hypothetical protein
MPDKLVDPEAGRSPNNRVRGTEFGVHCDRNIKTRDKWEATQMTLFATCFETALARFKCKTDEESEWSAPLGLQGSLPNGGNARNGTSAIL